MAEDDELEYEVTRTLATLSSREVLLQSIIGLVDSKVEAAMYHSGLASPSCDPSRSAVFYEKLLAGVIDRLVKDEP